MIFLSLIFISKSISKKLLMLKYGINWLKTNMFSVRSKIAIFFTFFDTVSLVPF